MGIYMDEINEYFRSRAKRLGIDPDTRKKVFIDTKETLREGMDMKGMQSLREVDKHGQDKGNCAS